MIQQHGGHHQAVQPPSPPQQYQYQHSPQQSLHQQYRQPQQPRHQSPRFQRHHTAMRVPSNGMAPSHNVVPRMHVQNVHAQNVHTQNVQSLNMVIPSGLP